MKQPSDCWHEPMFIDGQKNTQCELWKCSKKKLELYLTLYHPEYLPFFENAQI